MTSMRLFASRLRLCKSVSNNWRRNLSEKSRKSGIGSNNPTNVTSKIGHGDAFENEENFNTIAVPMALLSFLSLAGIVFFYYESVGDDAFNVSNIVDKFVNGFGLNMRNKTPTPAPVSPDGTERVEK